MDELFDQLIADFHDRELPALTRRDAQLPRLPGKVDSVIGMRRAGKTWFLYQVVGDMVSAGRPRESLLYLNFEDERLLPVEAHDLQRIVDVYFRRYPSLREQECTFLFDEIQVTPGWERFVRRIVDTERAHICITGSSAKLLSREIATSLRGRAITTEIFPFSFAEALRHQNIEFPAGRRPGAALRARLENRLEAYLTSGGFPEVQGLDSHYRIRVLQSYLDVVILRDVLERHGMSNPAPLRHLIRHLLGAPASLFSVNKFYNDLRSRGVSVSKNTLHELLVHLSDAFLFFPVTIHTASERAREVNPRKVYPVDTGLVRAFAKRRTPDWGQLLESFVFLHLRRARANVEYYRTSSGHEVDFLATAQDGTLSLLQSCADMTAKETSRREIDALAEAMAETGLDAGTVVTMNDEETIQIPAGRVEVVPAWRWALGISS